MAEATSMEWLEVAKDLNAGTVGGVAGIIAGHPLDTIKVRLQTEGARHGGVWPTLRHITAHEGVGALYRGLLSPVLSNAPINAVVFGVQGSMARWLLQRRDRSGAAAAAAPAQLTPLQHLLAGASAGAVQTVFAAPAEHVKIQLQVMHGRVGHGGEGGGGSSVAMAQRLYRAYGLRGVCRGWEMTLLRDVPAFGVYFFAYEMAKTALTDGDAARETDARLLLAGGLAGSASWFVSQPMDVVKSCVQGQSLEASTSAWRLTREHVAAEGPRFFLKGFGATMVRAFPVSAVTFLVYEKSMQWMS